MTSKLFLAASFTVGMLTMTPCFAQDTTPPPPSQERQERQGRLEGAGGPRPMRMTPLQAALDTNKDGEISAQEIANAVVALKVLDKNKDGKLSADELRPVAPPVGPTVAEMVARVMEFDANGDGKLSKDELPGQIQSVFVDADTNKNGILTEAELTPFLEKQEKEAEARAAAQTPRPTPPGERGGGGPPEGRGGQRPMRVSPLQAALDTNGDGEISATELANAIAALKALDKNGDGKISMEEMRPAPPPDARPEGPEHKD